MELRGFSRNYAREVVEAGYVLVGGKAETRPGVKTKSEFVTVLADDMPFVSRGGYKLDAALNAFAIELSERVCLDAGASTGGFTDCMLQRGAALVYAVDVGHGQLDRRLLADNRVVSMEGTDIRNLSLPEKPAFAAADLSFISLTKALPAISSLLVPTAGLVCLIKPQFEMENRFAGKSGFLKSQAARLAARDKVLAAMETNGFTVKGVMDSPVAGGDGNMEYLAYGVNK